MANATPGVLAGLFTRVARRPSNPLTPEAGRAVWDFATATGDETLGEQLIRTLAAPDDDLLSEWAAVTTPITHRVAYLLRADTPVDVLEDAVTNDDRVSITRALARNLNTPGSVIRRIAETSTDVDTLKTLLDRGRLDSASDDDDEDRISDRARVRVYKTCLLAAPDHTTTLNWMHRLHELDDTALNQVLADQARDLKNRIQLFTALTPGLRNDNVGNLDVARVLANHCIADKKLPSKQTMVFVRALLAHRPTPPAAELANEILQAVDVTGRQQSNKQVLVDEAAKIIGAVTGADDAVEAAERSNSPTFLTDLARSELELSPQGNIVTEAVAANPATPQPAMTKLARLHPKAAAFGHPNDPAVTATALTTDPTVAADTELWALIDDPAEVLRHIGDQPTSLVVRNAFLALHELGRLDDIADAITARWMQITGHEVIGLVAEALIARAGDATGLLALEATFTNGTLPVNDATLTDMFAVLDLVAD